MFNNSFIEKEKELARKAEMIGDTLLKSRAGYMLIDTYGIALCQMGFVNDLWIVEDILDGHAECVFGDRIYGDLLHANGGVDPALGREVVRILRDDRGEYVCPIADVRVQEYYRMKNAEVRRQRFITEQQLSNAKDLTIVKG